MIGLTPAMRAALPAVLIAACAMVATAPSATSHAASPSQTPLLRPLVVGWEQFFKLDWQVGQRHGRRVVVGHIYNDWGTSATNVRLLVDGLDSAGRVIEQRVAWLGGDLTPGTSAPFEVAVAQPAAAYRVSVFAFDWVERGRGLRN